MEKLFVPENTQPETYYNYDKHNHPQNKICNAPEESNIC